MTYEFKMTRRVDFHETDMAGIMHFSNYFRFMEATEHAFFRSLEQRVHDQDGDAMHGWARVHAECSYAEPLRYDDVVEIQLLVRAVKPKAITYDFCFRRVDRETGEAGSSVVARGAMTAVYVKGADGVMRAAPMPAEVAAAIDVAPAEQLESETGGR